MANHCRDAAPWGRLLPIAGCVSLAFGGFAYSTFAAAKTLVVGSCADDPLYPNNIRDVVASAGDLDTVDLSQLSCVDSKITLNPAKGEIQIKVPNLTIIGSAVAPITISGSGKNRVFHHLGTGTLNVNDLILADGVSPGSEGNGGCLASSGSVNLSHVTVTNCKAQAAVGSGVAARGGGVYAVYGATLVHSTVTENTCDQQDTGKPALGGGVFASDGNVVAKYSTVSGNTLGSDNSMGGAIYSHQNVVLLDSTIDRNSAYYGAILANKGATILNSTISSNRGVAVLFQDGPNSFVVRNSTIAFNDNFGVAVNYDQYSAYHSSVDIESSIIAGNSMDLWVLGNGGITVTGSANAIKTRVVPMEPFGFVALTGEPCLAPLSNHGGETRTHALLPYSPLIGGGFAGTAPPPNDQRGTGFARISDARIDIGAYERQQNDDLIFYSGLETNTDPSQCPLPEES